MCLYIRRIPVVYVCNPYLQMYMSSVHSICRLCSCINYHIVHAKSIFIISGCVVVYVKCVCVYVASVSISAGCGVFIVHICQESVYILVCNCINWVTIC